MTAQSNLKETAPSQANSHGTSVPSTVDSTSTPFVNNTPAVKSVKEKKETKILKVSKSDDILDIKDQKEDSHSALLGNSSFKVEEKTFEVPAKPDNTEKGLNRSALVGDARGFLRAKGVADHLYSDDAAVKAFEEFRKTEGKGFGSDHQPKMPTEAKTEFKKTESETPIVEAITK